MAVGFLARTARLVAAGAGDRPEAHGRPAPRGRTSPAAGDDLVVTFRVTNGSQLPGLQVTLPDATGDLGGHRQTIELASLGTVPAAHRGERAAAGAARGPPPPDALGRRRGPPGTRPRPAAAGRSAEVTVYPRLVDAALLRALCRHGAASRRGAARFRATRRVGVSWHPAALPRRTAEPRRLEGHGQDRKPDAARDGRSRPAATSRCCSTARRRTSSAKSRAATSSSPCRLPARWPTSCSGPDGASICSCMTAAGGRPACRPTTTAVRRCSTAWPRRRPDATIAAGRLAAAAALRTADGLARTQILTLVVLSLDRELVRALIALAQGRPARLALSTSLRPARSRPPPRPPQRLTSPDLLAALAAAGVVCLTLRARRRPARDLWPRRR